MNKIREGTPVTVRILDTTDHVMTGNAMFPFAYEEVECRRIGEGKSPLIHVWRHERAFIMGLRDRKLPYAIDAMKWLEQQGVQVIVRHSGGAAVPLDQGVINLSVVMPKQPASMDFKADFQTMAEILTDSLSACSNEVRIGEISGSYCPGEYDLSIRGQKFCGMAQRRQTQGFIVQAFIVVEGMGTDRTKLVQDFYRIAGGSGKESDVLKVEESSVASLSELVGLSSVHSFVSAIKIQLEKQFGADVIYEKKYDPRLLLDAEQMGSILKQRYDK